MQNTVLSRPGETATRVWSRLPIWLSCGLYVAVTAAIIVAAYAACGHHFTYPLDDAYINMSIAKHLALGGVWGTSYQFASAASSPGFICILAVIYKTFGINQYAPLVINVLCCLGIIFIVAHMLLDFPTKIQAVAVPLVVILIPLWTMTAVGMEHSLQIFLCLLFLDLASPAIALGQRLNWKMLFVASLMASVRYECLFVAAGACFLLLLKRRWFDFAFLCIASWLMVLMFGVYFRLHGGDLFPNSVLLKGGAGWFGLFGFLVRGLHMAPLMAVGTWAAVRFRRADTPAKVAICISVTALWLHFFLARYGWVYRYEAYLIALGVVSFLLCYRERILSQKMGLAFAISVGALCAHAFFATVTLPGRSRAIHDQQVQTAKLLSIYPVPTALNDIGAPTYFTDTPILDLIGLGSQDVFRARYRHTYTTTTLQQLLAAHNVQTIAVYDTWFNEHPKFSFGGPPLPSEYTRVGQLSTAAPKGYLGSNTVSYYAVRGSEAKLLSALEKLATSLPAQDRLTLK